MVEKGENNSKQFCRSRDQSKTIAIFPVFYMEFQRNSRGHTCTQYCESLQLILQYKKYIRKYNYRLVERSLCSIFVASFDNDSKSDNDMIK